MYGDGLKRRHRNHLVSAASRDLRTLCRKVPDLRHAYKRRPAFRFADGRVDRGQDRDVGGREAVVSSWSSKLSPRRFNGGRRNRTPDDERPAVFRTGWDHRHSRFTVVERSLRRLFLFARVVPGPPLAGRSSVPDTTAWWSSIISIRKQGTATAASSTTERHATSSNVTSR